MTFTLRELQPTDGPAIRDLMQTEPHVEGMRSTTCFKVDPVEAWTTLKPDMVGVVVEAEGVPGIIGSATIAFDTFQVEGQRFPGGVLENGKIHHAYRGQGLGSQMAQWCVDRARARYDDACVIMSGAAASNGPSLATMRKWGGEVFTTLETAPSSALRKPPRPVPGIAVSPVERGQWDEVRAKSNQFYADFNGYMPLDDATFDLFRDGSVYHYRVAVDMRGNVVAGAMMSERARLMVDEFRNVPLTLRLANRVLRILPDDFVLRLMEANYIWYTDLRAARYLWRSIRYEFRDRASSFAASYDPRGPIPDVLQIKRWRTRIVPLALAIAAPVPLSAERLLCGRLRG